MTDERVVKTSCQCHSECGVLVHVKDGKVVKIEGDPDHPLSEGMICPRGSAFTQLLYHPGRLKYPLKRAGARGEGKWKRISWDEALDMIATKFKEIIQADGPQAIGYVVQDGPRTYMVPYLLLLSALGSPNVFGAEHICYIPTALANATTFGSFVTNERGMDFDNANCILNWGANPIDAHPPLGAKILRAKQRGAKLIVVDPRFTALASKADIWLQVRPATDCALALGMLNVIINNNLYDKEFVDRWCIGFDKLKERVQEYPVARVSEITWVPQEEIIKAAKMYATIKPACQHSRVAVEQIGTNSFQTLRALSILVAITGNLDIKGGNLFTQYPKGYISQQGLWRRGVNQIPQEVREQQIGFEDFPWYILRGAQSPTHSVLKAILTGKPYPLKAVYGVANLILSTEDSKQVVEALKKLEFSVFADFFPNPTTEYADIVLPAATWLEVDDLCDLSFTNFIAIRQKVIEPLYECKDEKWVAIELAKRMGVLDKFVTQAKTVKEYLDFQLRGMGLSFEEFREKAYIVEPMKYKKYEWRNFHTPTGKVELYSAELEKFGIDPLPHYEEPYESPVSTPELAKQYPLIAIFGRRHVAFSHAAFKEIPWLRELNPEPTIEIHPKTAEELGIKNGDWVWIETPRGKGRIKQKVVLTLGIHPKVVAPDPFWWFPERGGPGYGVWESNVNVLTSCDPPHDPATGATLLRGGLCKVYKVED